MFLTYLFLLHFIADFLLQSHWMATRKSTDVRVLSYHIAIITGVFLAGAAPFLGWLSIPFVLLNSSAHAAIDWNIWRLYKKSVQWREPMATAETWRHWEDHWFFVTIGADQLLHGATILLLAEWLLK